MTVAAEDCPVRGDGLTVAVLVDGVERARYEGGWGTRLGRLTEAIPKPMVEIGGRPILWHIMKIYGAFGCRRFILTLRLRGGWPFLRRPVLPRDGQRHDRKRLCRDRSRTEDRIPGEELSGHDGALLVAGDTRPCVPRVGARTLPRDGAVDRSAQKIGMSISL